MEKKTERLGLLLQNGLSPGDVLVMSAAIESLHEAHPGKFTIAVQTSCDAVYEFNPWVYPSKEGFEPVRMQYPLIHKSDQRPVHFLQGYCDFLSDKLGVPVPLCTNRPHIYLSAEEKAWMPQVQEIVGKRIPYWVINAGHKTDFTAKYYGAANWQAVVDALYGKIQFVQVGASEHVHPELRGVINLVGKTDTRQLIRLCYHAEGGVGPSTFTQHILAAFEKPYVCLLGGREPVSWVQYPRQTTFHTIGALPCCAKGACWKSRTVKVGDNDSKDDSLCENPVLQPEPVPKCLAMIKPSRVVDAIEQYYTGGMLAYG